MSDIGYKKDTYNKSIVINDFIMDLGSPKYEHMGVGEVT